MKQLIWFFLFFASFALVAQDLVVHEWGTFTSFVGSDGKRQPGMHHEEETLPSFVYGAHNPQSGVSYFDEKNICGKIPCQWLDAFKRAVGPSEVMPKNPVNRSVSQKMETPVIYFYGDVGQKLKVDIDFPQGIISQYYPRAAAYFPSYDNVTTVGPSRFSFELELNSKDYIGNMPPTTANSIWNASREVASNTINIGSENEKFIFYRGIGDFDAKFEARNDGQKLTLLNHSSAKIMHAFVLNSDGDSGIIQAIGEIQDEKVVDIPKKNQHVPQQTYVALAKSLITEALRAEGLFEDEARALVNTWEQSYFKSPGLRVLYLVPRLETDRIIPLTVSPSPSHLVRVLIGRMEIMSRQEEENLLKAITNEHNFKANLGRFFEPKLHRLLDIAKQKRVAAKTVNKINQMLDDI